MAFGKELSDFVSGFKAGGEFVESSRKSKRADREQDWKERYYDRGQTETERRNRVTEAETERAHREDDARGAGFESDDQRRRFELTKGGGGGGSFGDSDMDAAAKGIRTIESGSPEGNYGARGKVTKNGDRAYGAYQVMGNNIPAWTKAHFGKSLTPDEFLQNREAQDAVFKGEFGNYMKQYGPAGAAQAWFGGPKAVGKRGVYDPVSKRYTGDYGDQFVGLFDKFGGGNASRRVPIPKVETAALPPPPTAAAKPAAAPPPLAVIPAPFDQDADPNQKVSYLEPDEEDLGEPTVYADEGGVIPELTPNAGPGMSTAAANVGTFGVADPMKVDPKRVSTGFGRTQQQISKIQASMPKAKWPTAGAAPGAAPGAIATPSTAGNGAANAKASVNQQQGRGVAPAAVPGAPGAAPGAAPAPVAFSGAWNPKVGAAPTVANMDQSALDALPDGYFAQMAANIATASDPSQAGGIAEWQKAGLIDYARWRLGQGMWDNVMNRSLQSAREQQVRMQEHARGGMVRGYAEGGYVDDPDDESAWAESDPEPVPTRTRPTLAPAPDGETRAAQEAARSRLAARQEEYAKTKKSEKAKQEEEDEKDDDEPGITQSTQPPPRAADGQKTPTDRKLGVVPDDEAFEASPAAWQDQPAPAGGVNLPTEPPPRAIGGQTAPSDRRLGVVPEGEAAEGVPTPWQDRPAEAPDELVPITRAPVQMNPVRESRTKDDRVVPAEEVIPAEPQDQLDANPQQRISPYRGVGGSLTTAPTSADIRRREAAAKTPAEARTKDDLIAEPVLPTTEEKPVIQTGDPKPKEVPKDPVVTGSTSATGGTTGGTPKDTIVMDSLYPALDAGIRTLQTSVTQHDPKREGPVPTREGQQERLKRFAANKDAPPEKLIREVFERVDPENKLDQEQKMLKAIQDQYDFWIAEGRPDRAAASVASMLSYSKKAASTFGSLAQAAFDNGDNIAGMQILSRAYATIPDGRSLVVDPMNKDGKPDKDGNVAKYEIVDRSTGKVISSGTVNQNTMMDMAGKLADGSGWLQTMMTAAQGGSKPASAREQKKIDTAEEGAAYSDLTTKLTAARENPDDEEAQKAAKEAADKYRGIVGTEDMGRRSFQGAYRAAGYDDTTMPAEYRPKATGSGPGGSARSAAQVDKREMDATTESYRKERDALPADSPDRRKLGMATAEKLYNMPSLTRKDSAIKQDDINAAVDTVENVADNDAAKKIYSGVIRSLMVKNNVSADQAVMFVEALRAGNPWDINDNGKAAVQGVGEDFFIKPGIFADIKKLGRTGKT